MPAPRGHCAPARRPRRPRATERDTSPTDKGVFVGSHCSGCAAPRPWQTGFGPGRVNSIPHHGPFDATGGDTTNVTRTGSAPGASG
jgi:hypothetical protein